MRRAKPRRCAVASGLRTWRVVLAPPARGPDPARLSYRTAQAIHGLSGGSGRRRWLRLFRPERARQDVGRQIPAAHVIVQNMPGAGGAG